MGRLKGSKNKINLSNAGERPSAKVSEKDKYKPMSPADKERILELAKTKTIKEIAGIVEFDMNWIASMLDALMPDIKRKMELTKNFFQ